MTLLEARAAGAAAAGEGEDAPGEGAQGALGTVTEVRRVVRHEAVGRL